MNIIGTQYTLERKSFEIYIAGCAGNPHCEGCHNPESWDFTIGKKFNPSDIIFWKEKILMFDGLINNISIFGGEPLDNNWGELEEMLRLLKNNVNKEIWIYTRYSIEEVPKFVKLYCDYIKCGRYIKELKTENNIQYGVKLATKNQKIYKKGVDYV